MTGPLQGYRVVEVAGIGPGPFAAMLLADMGADVVRRQITFGYTLEDLQILACDRMTKVQGYCNRTAERTTHDQGNCPR